MQETKTRDEVLLEIAKRYEIFCAEALLQEDFLLRDKLKDIPTLLRIVHDLKEDLEDRRQKMIAIKNACETVINA